MINANNYLLKDFRLRKLDYFLMLLILGVYSLSKLPSVLYVYSSSILVHFADFEIQTNLLLGDGWLPRINLGNLYISPAAPFFVIPPGIFYIYKCITQLIGSSYKGYFVSTFVFQMLVPVLTYYLGRFFLIPVFAFFLGILSAFYFTGINILADFWIQPLMLISLILLCKYFLSNKFRYILFSGFAAFFIIFLKHNVGINFLIATSMALVVFNLQKKVQANKEKMFSSFIFLLFLIPFGVAAFKYISIYRFFDEFVFYLLPSLVLFGGISLYIIRNSQTLCFNLPKLKKEIISFYSPIVALITIWLLVFSSRLGFSNYIYSLFGMGPKYLFIWDNGIVNFLKPDRILLQGFTILTILSFSLNNFNKRARNVTLILAAGCLIAGMFFWKDYFGQGMFMPRRVCFFGVWNFFSAFILTIVTVVLLYTVKTTDFKNIALAVIPIVGLWMYFPLESGHILLTKSFLFWLPIFIFCQLMWKKRDFSFYMCFFIVMFLCLYPFWRVAGKYQQIFRTDFEYILPDDATKLNVKLPAKLAREFRKSIDILEKNVGENDFLVLDTYMTLREYYSFLDIKTENYYMENRTGLVDKKVQEILKDYIDNKFNYVIVNKLDYEKDTKEFPAKSIYPVIRYLRQNKNFELVDKYVPSGNNGDEHLRGYYLFKRKRISSIKLNEQ